MVELAKIEQVDLREAWSNEAANFTPWLQDNIDQLGEALGMYLEVQEREASVGTFSLDLLARDTSNNRPVIIENQLGPTDHSHLGQLLTYAAGYDASAIVWIAKEFRDEHRAALDFLNGRTGEDTELFGVVLSFGRSRIHGLPRISWSCRLQTIGRREPSHKLRLGPNEAKGTGTSSNLSWTS